MTAGPHFRRVLSEAPDVVMLPGRDRWPAFWPTFLTCSRRVWPFAGEVGLRSAVSALFLPASHLHWPWEDS